MKTFRRRGRTATRTDHWNLAGSGFGSGMANGHARRIGTMWRLHICLAWAPWPCAESTQT
eukprot:1775912-Lingulodinium_polyedra.AAC.1